MVKKRRGQAQHKEHRQHPVPSDTPKSRRPLEVPKLIAPALALGLLAVVVVIGDLWLRGVTVNVSLDAPPVVSDEWRNDSVYHSRLWGTYRSNVYFGVRPRIPKSLASGLMWFVYEGQLDVRHTCEDGDRLQRYGWVRHDGTSFGQQEIVDHAMILQTDYLSRAESGVGETWTARFTGQSRISRPLLVSLVFYVYNEGQGEMAVRTTKKDSVDEVYGYTPEFTQFRVFFPRPTIAKDAVHNFLSTRLTSLAGLTDYIKRVFRQGSPHKNWPPILQLPGEIRPPETDGDFKPNFVAYQITTRLPFEIDMVFETGMFSAALSISGERFTNALQRRVTAFDDRFENTFQLQAKGFADSEVSFAKAVFSNLIGGIAYFYGESLVISRDMDKPLPYGPAALYTAVPSRSFFPRGFLWDEGFHQLVIAHWDTTIVKDVIAHWLDLINVEGWIPREQILGEEARSKVPKEFIVQRNENANPPTFFLTMETLLQRMEAQDSMDLVFLRRLYPRLRVWYDWFNTTQVGRNATSYRWRGRNGTTDRELNPKTLTSGLDDYPRPSHPTQLEYHVDLRCWMAMASGVMAKIANLLGRIAEQQEYKATFKALTDQRLLDRLHWDNRRKAYSDWGLHTSRVKLETVRPENPHLPPFKRRRVTGEPTWRFVNSFGYVNLFPFLLQIISPSSEKLGWTLDKLRNESLLWTDHGLRSLSRADPFYSKHNTEHDPPYWRGSIWLNMNYLAIRALHHYGNRDGPYRSYANRVYQELRSNLIRNMHDQYIQTGYVWEQYEDKTGKGKGVHPFTGWSSLIVLIMAEKY